IGKATAVRTSGRFGFLLSASGFWVDHQLIQESVHFFGRKYRRDAFGKLRSRNETSGVFLQQAFADAEFEEGAQRSELARDGAFFEFLRMKVADKFANDLVRNVDNFRGGKTGRREIGSELLEVFTVVQDGMRRRISHRAKIFKVPLDCLVH